MIIESWGLLGGVWLAIYKDQWGYDLMCLTRDFDTCYFPCRYIHNTPSLTEARRAVLDYIIDGCGYDPAAHGY